MGSDVFGEFEGHFGELQRFFTASGRHAPFGLWPTHAMCILASSEVLWTLSCLAMCSCMPCQGQFSQELLVWHDSFEAHKMGEEFWIVWMNAEHQEKQCETFQLKKCFKRLSKRQETKFMLLSYSLCL